MNGYSALGDLKDPGGYSLRSMGFYLEEKRNHLFLGLLRIGWIFRPEILYLRVRSSIFSEPASTPGGNSARVL